jgi:hypothetical protein
MRIWAWCPSLHHPSTLSLHLHTALCMKLAANQLLVLACTCTRIAVALQLPRRIACTVMARTTGPTADAAYFCIRHSTFEVGTAALACSNADCQLLLLLRALGIDSHSTVMLRSCCSGLSVVNRPSTQTHPLLGCSAAASCSADIIRLVGIFLMITCE